MPIRSEYQIGDIIHKGYETDVYFGLRKEDQFPVIIKQMKRTHPSAEALARFRREYEIMRMFDTDGVVKAYSLEKNKADLAIIAEDFNGKSLEKLLPELTFDLSVLLTLSIRIVKALWQIHQKNIIHKNINPGNIIWNPQTGQVKITDFGISTELSHESSEAITPAIIKGSLAYISPEQTGRMNRFVDLHTDFYSLGVTLYRVMTGYLPYESEDPLTLIHSHIARTPVSPNKLNPKVPRMIAEIIMKLMAKTAEDRYQSTFGIQADLQRCLDQIEKKGTIDDFKIGGKDIHTRFQIPQKLFGRDTEIQILLEVFERIRQGGKEIFLVGGQPGVGKSFFVSEIYQKIVESHGYLIYGKFDPISKDIPYSTLAQAFKGLAGQIAADGRQNVLFWKKHILDAIGKNGQALIDVIPDLESIIGKQPPIPHLPPSDARYRFNLTFLNVIQTFSKLKTVVTFLIDDLHWADEATLELIEFLMTDTDLSYLLFIGTYRNDGSEDTLFKTPAIRRLQKSETPVRTLFLKNLQFEPVNQLLAATLSCHPGKSEPVAALCMEKTHGNPFFVKQFLESLYTGGGIYLNTDIGRWQWNIEEIRKTEITDNVIGFMAGKIQKLPAATRHVLQTAACIGTQFELLTLSTIIQKSLSETSGDLKTAITENLIFPINDAGKFINIIDQELTTNGPHSIPPHLIPTFRFHHDRIQQAAYDLIPSGEKQKKHLQIGRQLLNQTPKNKLNENIFNIVSHFYHARDGIISQKEKHEAANLNLIAGKKAKSESAFKPSLNYFMNGIAMLPGKKWETQYDLTYQLYSEAAEAAFLCTDFDLMDTLTEQIIKNSRCLLDQVKIYDLKIQYYYAQNDLLKVIDEGLKILKLLGFRFSKNPKLLHVIVKILQTRRKLTRRFIDKIPHLHDMDAPEILAANRIMLHLGHAAYGAAPNLAPLLPLQAILSAIKHGIAPETPVSFAAYAIILCGKLGDIDGGIQFGDLALSLAAREKTKHVKARTSCLVSSMVNHWRNHLQKTLPEFSETYELGVEIGDFEYATLSLFFYSAYSFFSGSPLETLSREIADHSATIRSFKQETHFYFNEMIRQTMYNFMGKGDDPCRLAGEAYDEEKMLPIHYKSNDTSAIHMLFLYKLMLGYHFGRHQDALTHSDTVKKYLDGMISTAYIPLFHFYDALLRLALMSSAGLRRKRKYFKIIRRHQAKLKKWTAHAPMNFQHKWLLVEAERLRVTGESEKSARLYDQAISLALTHGYIQEAALGNELAAKAFLAEGDSRRAESYMREAVTYYTRWGAAAKAAFLIQNYPQLRLQTDRRRPETNFAVGSGSFHSSESLDLDSVIKASQAISGEIVLDQLMTKMLTVIIENAGAQKALLLSENDNQWTIESEAMISQDGINASMEFKPADPSTVPLSIIDHVAQTKNYIVLDNATQDLAFQKDAYITDFNILSILCTPIFHQGQLTNILYLENNLIAGAFTPDRLTLVQLLSSQAAISLQNASLYYRLQVSEKTYRSIFENAVEGIFQLSKEGKFISANPAMADILGYNSPEELMASEDNMKYRFFTEISNREQMVEEFRAKGHVTGFGISGVSRDNREIWCSLSIHAVYDSNGSILFYEGSVMDITDHKRREIAERETQAARAAAKAKGEFLANMSHEIRTPINAIIGMTDLTLKTGLSVKQKDYLKNIKSASGSLLNIVDDILNFSKIEAGKLEIDVVEFRISDIIEKISTLLSNAVSEKDLELVFSISDEIPEILAGDPAKIGQLLINLVSNAIKFTDFGEILLCIEPVKQEAQSVRLQFYVRDTGIGISKDHMKSLFDSFTQADGSITRKYGGTGLGLAICKSIIELMDGRIWVDSVEGRGSTFYFEIDCAFHDPSPQKPHPLPHEIKQMKVLLTDDSPVVRGTLTRQLETAGIQVTACPSGKNALELIQRINPPTRFDLLLIDYKMPGMDGLDTLERIHKEAEQFNAKVIIMVSEFDREKVEPHESELKISGYLIKPIQPGTLIESLMETLCPIREKSPAKNPQTGKIHSNNGIRLLLVEDNPINRQIAVEIMESHGLSVDTALNGLQAIESVKSGNYNIVLMDLQMPMMDGFAATRTIREDIRNKKLPIIAMTAHCLDESREKCLAAGMNDFIPKPFEAQQLMSVLSKFVPLDATLTSAAAKETHAQKQASRFSNLPDALPGINIQSGVSRLGGREHLYIKVIWEFYHEYRGIIHTIRQAINDENFEFVQRTAHTLKSLAGNLGAEKLQQAARQLEKEAATHGGGFDQRAIDTLEKNLGPVTTSIRQLLDDYPDSFTLSPKKGLKKN